jgi:hypothetical protein
MAEKIECAGKSNKAHPDAITAALHQAGHQVKYQEFPGMCHTYNVPSPSSGKAFGFYLRGLKTYESDDILYVIAEEVPRDDN